MKNLVLCFICILCVVSCGKYEDEYLEVNLFPEYDWVDVVDSSTTAFVSRYWNTTQHCFNNTFDGEVSMYDYWPEAHGLDVLIDAYLRTGDDKYKDDIYDFFDGVRSKNSYLSNWKADYYDDMGWHGLAHMRAFEATGDVRYENSSKDLWTWITEGWSDTEGGGIQWRTTSDELGESKGIPANGPACIIAARRAQLYPDEVVGEFTDLEWALRIYDWMKYNRTVLSTGRVYEVYSSTNGDYSYDVGTFIGSALELYKITGEQVYFNDAIKAANYHISSNVYLSNNVMTDFGEQAGDGSGHDVNLFKGIFVRYFSLLIQHPDLSSEDRVRYLSFLKNNANYLWTYGTQKSPVIKFSYQWWSTPEDGVVWGDLRSAISASTTLEAMALLEKDGFFE